MKDDYNTNSRSHLCIFSLKGWENGLFELRSERVKSFVTADKFIKLLLWHTGTRSWWWTHKLNKYWVLMLLFVCILFIDSTNPDLSPASQRPVPSGNFSFGNHLCYRQRCDAPYCAWYTTALRKSFTVNSPLMDTLVSGQLYLRTLFSIPVFTSSQTLYLRIPASGHSRKRTRTLLKMEIGFVSLFAHSRKRTLYVLTTVNQQIYDLTEQQISGDRFSQAVRSFDTTSKKSFSCYLWLPNET